MPSAIRIDPVAPEPEALREVAEAISRGAVVVYPTDTLYGLGASAHDVDAVARVCALKGRRLGQPLSVITADVAQVRVDVGVLSLLGQRLAARWWPGPLTLVIAAHDRLAPPCRGADGSVAVRVPDHAVACALARGCGDALGRDQRQPEAGRARSPVWPTWTPRCDRASM